MQLTKSLEILRGGKFDFFLDDYNKLIENRDIFIKYLEERQINLVILRGMNEGNEVKLKGAIEEIDFLINDMKTIEMIRDTYVRAQNAKESVDFDEKYL